MIYNRVYFPPSYFVVGSCSLRSCLIWQRANYCLEGKGRWKPTRSNTEVIPFIYWLRWCISEGRD